jgi:hypothetical protein
MAETKGEPVEFIRELDGFTGDACLVKRDGKHYVVSTTYAFGTGLETLIFPADAAGNVASWAEVGGGRGIGRSLAIADFAKRGPDAWEDE